MLIPQISLEQSRGAVAAGLPTGSCVNSPKSNARSRQSAFSSVLCGPSGPSSTYGQCEKRDQAAAIPVGHHAAVRPVVSRLRVESAQSRRDHARAWPVRRSFHHSPLGHQAGLCHNAWCLTRLYADSKAERCECGVTRLVYNDDSTPCVDGSRRNLTRDQPAAS
jgi:hypothetical protein